MNKRLSALIASSVLILSILTGCSSQKAQVVSTVEVTSSTSASEAPVPEKTEDVLNEIPSPVLEDGLYYVDFNTDSSMFHVNEAKEGKGLLTVENGAMSVHISLVSKSILNLFVGSAKDARKDGAVLLQPTEDPITYKDGYTETVYGFDVPVAELDKDFALAIIGKKGTWYDHTVSVSNPIPIE